MSLVGYINGNSESGTQPSGVDEMLRILVGPLPAGLALGSILLLYFYPLTTEVVDKNVQTLKQQRKTQLTNVASFGTFQTAGKKSVDNEKTALLETERCDKVLGEETIFSSDLETPSADLGVRSS